MSSFPQRSIYTYLLILMVAAFVLRIAVFVVSPSIYQSDEIFQVQEPAHRLAFGNGIETWEYRIGGRSWVLPTVVAGIMKATVWLGPGSSGYTLAVAIATSLLSLSIVLFSFLWCRKYLGDEYALAAAFATAIWYELVYFASHASAEVTAGNLLLPGVYLGSLETDERRRWDWRLTLSGVLLGLAAALRMQLAPAVFVVAAWVIVKDWRKRLLPVAAGLAIVAIAFGLTDALTWSYPFHSYFANFRENLIRGKAASFGVLPWYYYFVTLFLHSGPLPILAAYGARRAPILGWSGLAVLLPHVLISHKEYRFIYPLLPFLITVAAIGTMDLVKYVAEKTSSRSLWASARATLLLTAGFFLVTSAVVGARFPRWRHDTGFLRAFGYLSRTPEICGLAIAHDNWFSTGGYTYLHRPIPVFLYSDLNAASNETSAFNGIVAAKSNAMPLAGYSPIRCWDGICVYQRAGGCQPGNHENEFNEILAKRGE